MTSRRFGVTEGVVVFEVLVIAACLAMPALHATSNRQRAVRVAKEIRQVTAAAIAARGRTGAWPEPGVAGNVPASLKQHLPARFKFDAGSYRLDWVHWRLSDGVDSFARRSEFVGVSVTTGDPQLLGLVTDLLGTDRMNFTVGNCATFVVSDTGLLP